MALVIERGNRADVLRDGNTYVVECRSCGKRREFHKVNHAKQIQLKHDTTRGHNSPCADL